MVCFPRAAEKLSFNNFRVWIFLYKAFSYSSAVLIRDTNWQAIKYCKLIRKLIEIPISRRLNRVVSLYFTKLGGFKFGTQISLEAGNIFSSVAEVSKLISNRVARLIALVSTIKKYQLVSFRDCRVILNLEYWACAKTLITNGCEIVTELSKKTMNTLLT